MGLDITAYSRLTKLDAVFYSDGEPIDRATKEPIANKTFQPYVNPDFPGREDTIVDSGVYHYEKEFRFRAGSYSGYGDWRRELTRFAGWPAGGEQDAIEGPFYELIWFADNQGTIGPVTSAKLAQDFAEYQAQADRHHDKYWREKYNEWRKAFQLASDNGAVSFH